MTCRVCKQPVRNASGIPAHTKGECGRLYASLAYEQKRRRRARIVSGLRIAERRME